MSRVFIASGGSGGHLAPAIAIAQRLSTHLRGSLCIGTTRKVVDQKMQKHYACFDFVAFESAPLVGGIGSLVKATVRNLFGTIGAVYELHRRNVETILATGGFGCVPVLLAGFLLGRRMLIHESNSVPGKVTRWFRFSLNRLYATDLLAPHWDQVLSHVKTGFPIRNGFEPIEAGQAKVRLGLDSKRPLITIFGGSQGARKLSQTIERIGPQWIEKGFQVLCVCGPENYQPKVSGAIGKHFYKMTFVDDMAALFYATDLLVSRSGAGSIGEIAKTGCPTVLVPLPTAADNHQFHNASAFSKAGCAYQLQEESIGELNMLMEHHFASKDAEVNLKESMQVWSKSNANGIESLIADLSATEGLLAV